MRLFIGLGLLWLTAGVVSVQDIGINQGNPRPMSGSESGSTDLNEQETQITKKQGWSVDQPQIKDKQNKDVLGTGAKEEAVSDELVYGTYTTNTDKNGRPVTIEYSASPELEYETKSEPNLKQPANSGNVEESTVDLNEKENKPEERTPLKNDDNIHELSHSFEEAKVIHEEGSEETDSAGVIHGKYTYTLERDGIPTTIEYDVSPETGFIVTHFYKQKSVKAEENSKLTLEANVPLDPANPETVEDLIARNYKIAAFEMNIPNYEHSTVLAKYKPRIRRSDDSTIPVIPGSTIKSPSPLGEDVVSPVLDAFDTGIPAEIGKVNSPDESESNPTIDASYKFGFSVDGQSRNEESDAKGNVIGSYSYVDYDGLMTKVEYEAGANRGFVVKRISHEQLEPLEPKESKYKSKNISPEFEQKPEADVTNEKEAKKYLDEVISIGSSLEAKNTPHNIDSDNPGSNLENEGYGAQDNKAFSVYGLPTEQHSISPVDLDIRRAIAISEKNNQHKSKENVNVRRVVMRRQKKPNDNSNFISVMPDGSYAFSYKTNDHSRRESVDSLGNVHSSYQQSTKRDGTTLVVFERKVNKNAPIKTNGNNRYISNILNQNRSREAPGLHDDYSNQSHDSNHVPKVFNRRSRKNTNGVVDYIMRHSRV